MFDIPSDFLWSFGIGSVIIILFAYDQLNRPSYDQAKKLARMLKLLLPADIRSQGVFMRAYMFYTLLMLALYTVACFAGAVVVAALFGAEAVGGGVPSGADVGGAASPQAGVEAPAARDVAPVSRWDSRTPLVVSLLMMGLMPNPNSWVFHQIERKLRALSHRLVGIPNSVFSRSDALRRARLNRAELDALTASSAAVDRVDRTVETVRATLGEDNRWNVQRLERALLRTVVARLWVLDRDVWPATIVRDRYVRLEQDLRERAEAFDVEVNLLVAASNLVNSDKADPARTAEVLRLAGVGAIDMNAEGQVERLRDFLRKRWVAAIDPAEELSRDVCALMMLYLEQDERLPAEDESSRQLVQWLVQARDRVRASSQSFDALFLVTIAILALMGVGGGLARALSFAPGEGSHLAVALSYVVTTLSTYAPAMLVAMSIRDSRLDRVDWRPAFGGVGVAGLQFGSVFVWCCAASLIFVLVSHVLAVVGAVGIEPVMQKLPQVLAYALSIEWPRAFLGGMQGVFVVLSLDLATSAYDGAVVRKWGLRLPTIHGLLFLLLSIGATSHAASVQGSAIDVAALLYHGVLSALLGFATSASLLRLLGESELARTGGGPDGDLLPDERQESGATSGGRPAAPTSA